MSMRWRAWKITRNRIQSDILKKSGKGLDLSRVCGVLIEPHLSLYYHAIQNNKLTLGKATRIPASIERSFQLHKVGECGGRFDPF
jgi:hypothetical protein